MDRESPCGGGACTPGGSCSAKQRRCDTASGVPQVCSTQGEWENQPSCRTDQVCAGGECLCRAAFTTCGDQCVTLETDGKHCGRCGHDCLGGECIGGTCQPYEIVESGASSLAVDSTHVYWLDQLENVGNLRRVSKRGGAVETLASDLGYPGDVVVSDGQVYWGTSSSNPRGDIVIPGIFQAGLDGSGRKRFADAPNSVAGLSVANGMLFWGQWNDDGSCGFFNKALRSDATPAQLATDGSGGFTVVGDCLFYLAATSSGAVSLRKQCGNEAPVARFNTTKRISLSPRGAADAESLYFGSDEVGLMRLPLSGDGNPTKLADGREVNHAVVEDGRVYYVDGETGAHSCTNNWALYGIATSIGSAPVLVLPAPLDCPGNLTVDDLAIYYTTSLGIFLIAK
jgi:hypothetical protein